MSNKITAATAAAASIAAVRAHVAVGEAVITATVAFAQSARTFYRAGLDGVSDVEIKDAVIEEGIKAGLISRSADGKIKKSKGAGDLIYTSSSSVGAHRRTGWFLALDGDLPTGEDGLSVTAEGVQSLLFNKVPLRPIKGRDEIETVDEILSSSADKGEAHARLVVAARLKAEYDAAVKAKHDAAVQEEEEADDDTPKVNGEVTLAKRFQAIAGNVGKILDHADDSDEWAACLASLQAITAQFITKIDTVQAAQDAAAAAQDESDAVADAVADAA